MRGINIPKIFFALAIFGFMVFPKTSLGFSGTLNDYISSIQIGNEIRDVSISTAATKYKALDGCAYNGQNLVKFNLKKPLPFKNIQFRLACVNSSYFALNGDVASEKVLFRSNYSFPGNFTSPELNFNLEDFAGQVCKVWLVDRNSNKYFENTRPFYICASGEPEIEVVRYWSGSAGTEINADARNIKAGQDVEAELSVKPLDKTSLVFSLGKRIFRQNGKVEIFYPNLFLKSKYLIDVQIKKTTKEQAVPKPASVKFGDIKCSASGTTISVQGNIENPGSGTPAKAWILGYLCSQPQNEKFYKYLGVKDRLNASANLSGVAEGLPTDARYCFEIRLQDKAGKVSKGSDQGKIDDCTTGKNIPSKPANVIAFKNIDENGLSGRYIVIDNSDKASAEIGLWLVENRLFKGAAPGTVARNAGVDAGMTGLFFNNNFRSDYYLLPDGTFARNGKLIRYYRGGSAFCMHQDGTFEIARLRVSLGLKIDSPNFPASKNNIGASDVNAQLGSNDVNVYTEEWGNATPSNVRHTCISVANGKITAVKVGPCSIPKGGYAMAFSGGYSSKTDCSKDSKGCLRVGMPVSLQWNPAQYNEANLARWKTCKYIFSGQPTLLKNGQTVLSSNNPSSADGLINTDALGYPAPRSVFGINRNKNTAYFVYVSTETYPYLLVPFLKKIGITDAFDMDGGGSSFVYRSGQVYTGSNGYTNANLRSLPTIIFANVK